MGEKPTATGALPDYVKPFLAELQETDRRLGIESSDFSLATLAWSRWAGTLTNRELGEFVMFIRAELVKPEDNALGVKLEEIWRRLKTSPKRKRRR